MYFDIGSIKKSDLVELVLTAMAIYQLQTNFPGIVKKNKRITRIPMRCSNKHNLSFSVILDKIKITINFNLRREGKLNINNRNEWSGLFDVSRFAH